MRSPGGRLPVLSTPGRSTRATIGLMQPIQQFHGNGHHLSHRRRALPREPRQALGGGDSSANRQAGDPDSWLFAWTVNPHNKTPRFWLSGVVS